MSDDLVISGGGSFAVATDELLYRADALSRIGTQAGGLAAQLVVLDRRLGTGSLEFIDAPISAAAAEDHLDTARRLLEDIAGQSAGLARGLDRSAEQYGLAERSNQAMIELLSAKLGYSLGVLAPLLLGALAPLILSLYAGVSFARLVDPDPLERYGDELGRLLRENNELLTDPVTVALLRSLVMSSDDFAAGFSRLPADIAGLLGDQGLGLTGLDTSAVTVLLLGSAAGLLGESAVRIVPTTSGAGSKPPQGLGERIERIPDAPARDDGAQVRVERYTVPGEEDRFEVYIAGTVDFAFESTDEPWDMTSNVTGMAGIPPGSYHAVVDAMAEAGVTSSNPVVFTGYSQGGLVAAMLAGSGDYATHGLVTVGAPTGQLELAGDFPMVAIEHTDDIVPAIGGTRIDPGVLVIQRELFAGRDVPSEFAVPAHQLDQYQQTARLADEAKSDLVREALRELDRFAAGSSAAQDTTWRAERVQN